MADMLAVHIGSLGERISYCVNMFRNDNKEEQIFNSSNVSKLPEFQCNEGGKKENFGRLSERQCG